MEVCSKPMKKSRSRTDESALVYESSFCFHESPTGWRNTPYMPTFLKYLHCGQGFDIAMQIAGEILKDGSGDERKDTIHVLLNGLAHKDSARDEHTNAIHLLLQGLALKEDPGHEYRDAIQMLIKGLTAFGTDAFLCMTRSQHDDNVYKILTFAHHAAHVTTFLESMLSCPDRTTSPVAWVRKLDCVRSNLKTPKQLAAFFADRITCNCLGIVTKLLDGTITEKCRNCHKECDDKGELQDCSGCHMVKYCSRQCQIDHWSSHEKFCSKQYKKSDRR
jgi:hypothetical protein